MSGAPPEAGPLAARRDPTETDRVRTNEVVSRGDGPPLILVPGIQGRWEWMEPAILALSRHFRVLTFSLHDVGGGDFFDAWMAKIDRLVDLTGHPRVTLVGVSFGGVIAVRYAAAHPN